MKGTDVQIPNLEIEHRKAEILVRTFKKLVEFIICHFQTRAIIKIF